MYRNWPILVVDDEDVMRISLSAWLREDGHSVDTADSGPAAIDLARQREYAICFIDLKMPRGPDGIETMRAIRQLHPDSSIIIITAYASVDTAILAMKEGAQEYIVKPCNPTEISLMVSRIIRMKNLQRENVILRKKLARQYQFQDLLSKNPRMHEIFDLIREIADLRSNVLIQGESGTGKELVARAVHNSGARARRRFVAVPCAALAETLLESELFGYEKGSFTGAQERKKGKIELADGGTLFLDEIGDISPKLQVDLLRVLQERKFYRVGGSEEVSVDVRVIAATKVDLRQAMREGKFRDDLFYRLNVVNIHLPPLRERREDIPLLVRNFMVRLGHEMGRDMDEISGGALKLLLDYEWPGNIRELENAVERAMITARGRELTEADFGFLVRQAEPAADWQAPGNMSLADVEKQVIIATLQRLGGNIKAAAASLGIDRSTLYERIHKFGLPVERRKGTSK
jgi:DNA-binding NtrC family response regulator